VKLITLIALTLCGIAFTETFATGSHYVSSYTRRDGTYVQSHMAGNPSTGPSGTFGDSGLLMLFAIGGAIGLGVWLINELANTNKSQPVTMERQAAETIALFQQADLNRGFTPVANDLRLANDEICVFCDKAHLREVRPHRYSVGGSVRVMRGVYVGQRQYESKDSFDVVDAGEVFITNKRLVFTGLKTTINTAFKDIVSLDMHTDGLFLHSAKRQRASFIEFSRPLIVNMLVKYFQSNPDGAQPLRENEHITARYDVETKKLIVGRHEAKSEPALLSAPDRGLLATLPAANDGAENVIEANQESAEQQQPETTPNLYIYANDTVEGPFSLEQLTGLLESNTVNPATPCREADGEEWKTVGDYVVAPH
jgi:hypothetical protein